MASPVYKVHIPMVLSQRTYCILWFISWFTLNACHNKQKEKQSHDRDKPIPIVVATITPKLIPLELTLSSSLVGRLQADIYPRVAGRVVWFGPAEGQKVQKNAVILKIDRNDPGENFLATPTLSPLTGWIGRWLITNPGEYVSPAAPIATIVDDQALRASLHLSTANWLLVRKDTAVQVTVGTSSRAGKVIAIARAGDALSGSGSVTIEVDNADHSWRSGMVAKVRLHLDERQRLTVPASALMLSDEGAFVYVVKEERAHRRLVDYHFLSNDAFELIKGLEANEEVVTLGANRLSDGVAVKITATHSR